MLTAIYTFLLTLGGITMASGLWPVALLSIAAAALLAGRYELRWIRDKARGVAPRPVPPPPARLRH